MTPEESENENELMFCKNPVHLEALLRMWNLVKGEMLGSPLHHACKQKLMESVTCVH